MTTLYRLLIIACLLSTRLCAIAQTEAYEKHWHIEGKDTLPYRLLLPKNYDPSKKYPLILFLHGAGEKGSDNEAQLVHGSSLFLRDSVRSNYPAFVVFPQCSVNSFWSNVDISVDSAYKKRRFEFSADGPPTKAMDLLLDLINDLEKHYRFQSKQRYVGGLSMGGMGTFELVRRKSKYFAAAFPICGGAAPETANGIRKTSWWIFHGAKDDVVPPHFSELMVDALKAAGADVKFTMYPNATHNSWDSAFAEKNLLSWLFSQHK